MRLSIILKMPPFFWVAGVVVVVVLVATGLVAVEVVDVVVVVLVEVVAGVEVQATRDASTTITSRRPRSSVILGLFI